MRCVFVFILCFNIAFADKLEGIVEQIFSINKQVLKIQNSEQNTTNNAFGLKVIQGKKNKLLAKIPPLLTFNKEGFEDLYRVDEGLKNKLQINQKAGYLNAYNRDIIAIKNQKAKKIFYATLQKISTLSTLSLGRSELKNTIGEALFNISAIATTSDLQDSEVKNDYSFVSLRQDDLNLKAYQHSYIEILQYLLKHIDLLQSNFIFTRLDIAYIINAINSIVPNDYVNIGKVFLSCLILVFFWLCSLVLKRRKFTIFVILSQKKSYDFHTKQSVIKSTNRPLIPLLFVFALNVCCNVIFHPYPINSYISTIFSISYIVIFSWLTIGICNGYGIAFLNSFTSEDVSFRKDVVNLALKIFYFLVLIIALLMILKALGVDVSAIIASLGIGGLAVAWASRDILANFFSSILLLIDNSFSQGDWIECGDINGFVVEIGLRHTTVRTFDNSLLFVPNLKLANEPIRNWTRREVGRRIKMKIGLTYDSPKDKLRLCVEKIKQMLLNHPKIANPDDISLNEKDKKLLYKQQAVSIYDLQGYKRNMLVYLDEFSASSIDILVYCFSNSTNWQEWLAVKEEVMYNIIDIVEEVGLSFAFPSQSIYVESIPKNKNLECKNEDDE